MVLAEDNYVHSAYVLAASILEQTGMIMIATEMTCYVQMISLQCTCVLLNPISTGLFCLVVALGGEGGGVFSTPLP